MKNQSKSPENYILMPISKTRISAQDSPKVAMFFNRLQPNDKNPEIISLNIRTKMTLPDDEISVKVLDSIASEGAKLIRISSEELADFRFSYPGLRIIPEKFYHPAVSMKERIKIQFSEKQPATSVTFIITNEKNKGLSGVTAVLFTDFAAGKGASGITDAQGKVILKVNSNTADRLYVYPEHSYWGFFKAGMKLDSKMNIRLQPIVTGYPDALRYFYDTDNWLPIKEKVRIGIIDTGVGPHQDLVVSGGRNMVRGEDAAAYQDTEGHGTHVGGIIGARGSLKGVAPGAEIMSYRVFPKGRGASNFDIMKAIDQAIRDECDLINMSLGETRDDEAITSYIREAYNAGILCFAASGNNGRGPVSFPAAYSLAIAVSAMGRKGTFPDTSVQAGSIMEPFGTDQENFMADFSNIGTETDLTAPGVGIISTYPGDRYAVMDGTSMSCPAAVGMAARLLSGSPEILRLPRNQTRADEMLKFLSIYTKLLGFGANFEGKGMFTNNDELHT